MYAQSSETRQAERKAQREAQKHAKKQKMKRNYAIAVQALKEGKFVLGRADQLVFREDGAHLFHRRASCSDGR